MDVFGGGAHGEAVDFGEGLTAKHADGPDGGRIGIETILAGEGDKVKNPALNGGIAGGEGGVGIAGLGIAGGGTSPGIRECAGEHLQRAGSGNGIGIEDGDEVDLRGDGSESAGLAGGGG